MKVEREKPKLSSAPTRSTIRARFFRRAGEGQVECVLCPRTCRLSDGEHGACQVRACHQGQLVFTHYGRTTGLCIDPIEKKPLFHFLPGTATLSFGTHGCNLACAFCQNWHSVTMPEHPQQEPFVEPLAIAHAARDNDCASVAMTYNDPVVFFEYAAAVADACHRLDIRTVAVTAGYLSSMARPAFFRLFDAANVDLKAFTPRFYRELCQAELTDVLNTLVYIREHSLVWLELTTLLIPGENDSDQELNALTNWVARELGPHTPIHFTAFHPSYRLLDRPPTPPRTLRRARAIAKANGLHHVYIGNGSDKEGESTYCTQCHQPLIRRDRYAITEFQLSSEGTCGQCQTRLVGLFQTKPGGFGNRRQPIPIPPV